MFTDISDKILNLYNRSEEYLTDHYPQNYFDFYVDIGARGINNPWHINKLAENNPKTICIGYEPDVPYFKELKNHTTNLDNVYINKEGFGVGDIKIPDGTCDSVSLSDIVNKYEIDIDSNWSVKFDCEGCEYFLLDNESDIEILKKANHIAVEFHTTEHPTGNFFTSVNTLPDSHDYSEMWMDLNFTNTHSIFLTSKENGLRTYVLLSEKIMSEKDELFLKDLLP